MQMSPVLIAILGLLLLLIFLFAGMHIGIAMALVGFLGIVYMRLAGGFELGKAFIMALGAFTNGPFASTNKDSLVVIPMFTLMGVVCARAGISQDLYAACYKWVSRVRGGLAIATEVACAFFGAICGTMHFTPAVNTDHTTPLGWRNDTYNAEQLAAHAFMNDYNPIYVTDITRGNVNPLALGVEIGFRFRFTHYSQHKRCMCEEE